MTQTIYVPEDDDEAVIRILPTLHALAESKRNKRLADHDHSNNEQH